MPLLSCSAVKCMYNEERYCTKGDIMVTGDSAQKPGDTCCSSFREGEGKGKNTVGEPSGHIKVDCTACNCRHNRDQACQAESINISGPTACQCRQTECCTFDKEMG